MLLRKWEDLPEEMRIPQVKKYYDILSKKQVSLFFKRVFDIAVSFIMLTVFLPLFVLIAVAIKIDSRGPIFYRQVRVTQYNKRYRIFKFRSMAENSDKGSQVTLKDDARVTRVGKLIRRTRLDEICQLIDVLRGTMTFVGTRAEVPKYTEKYTPEMMATLLLPAGVTSLASIKYKNEAELLDSAEDTDKIYLEEILPEKMKYNLDAIEHFSFFGEIKIMLLTVIAVFKD